jgi:hypothetical protein
MYYLVLLPFMLRKSLFKVIKQGVMVLLSCTVSSFRGKILFFTPPIETPQLPPVYSLSNLHKFGREFTIPCALPSYKMAHKQFSIFLCFALLAVSAFGQTPDLSGLQGLLGGRF